MTKEQINKLETEIETIVTNDAKKIIESGLPTIFKLELINKLVTFMRHIGTNEIYAPGESNKFVYVKGKDGWAIVCPIDSSDDA